MALKKPVSRVKAAVALKKPASTLAMVTGDFKIVKDSMTVSGGKHQSYIQHVPSGTTKKQLVVAISDKMVDGKKMDHKQVAQALLKWASAKQSPWKSQVLKQRDSFLSSL